MRALQTGKALRSNTGNTVNVGQQEGLRSLSALTTLPAAFQHTYTPQEVGGTLIGEDGLVVTTGTEFWKGINYSLH